MSFQTSLIVFSTLLTNRWRQLPMYELSNHVFKGYDILQQYLIENISNFIQSHKIHKFNLIFRLPYWLIHIESPKRELKKNTKLHKIEWVIIGSLKCRREIMYFDKGITYHRPRRRFIINLLSPRILTRVPNDFQ